MAYDSQAVGAAVNTSANGPFPSSCDYANGYFATWLAFFFAMRFAWCVTLAFWSSCRQHIVTVF